MEGQLLPICVPELEPFEIGSIVRLTEICNDFIKLYWAKLPKITEVFFGERVFHHDEVVRDDFEPINSEFINWCKRNRLNFCYNSIEKSLLSSLLLFLEIFMLLIYFLVLLVHPIKVLLPILDVVL